jgi:cyclophilin family peptidyl-prolyl cis-trans isomerase
MKHIRHTLSLSALVFVLSCSASHGAPAAQSKTRAKAQNKVQNKARAKAPQTRTAVPAPGAAQRASPAPPRTSTAAPAAAAGRGNPVVALDTTLGTIRIELFPEQAPMSVKNFLNYVQGRHYDGLLFHRVTPGLIVQGGGLFADMSEKPAGATIKNEAGNGLKNERGTVAMARRNAPDSADAQFFINLKDNAFLNHRDDTPAAFGYAVFGRVIGGMEVVDKMATLPTTTKAPFDNVPTEPVVIRSARVVEP